MKIFINSSDYEVKVARTDAEKIRGLQNVKELPLNEGMLFVYDSPLSVSFWMKNTYIPLDIIFIDEDLEVIKVSKGNPKSLNKLTCDNVKYVLELNQSSGIKKGDELEFEDDEEPVMKVLGPDGSNQYSLWGGERIFSRKNTKILIKKAKKAELTQEEKDFKALGRYMFKCIKGQDERKPEYVQLDS